MRFILAEDFLRFLDFVSLFSCAFRLFSSDMAAPAARKNHATLSVSVINNNTHWSDLNKIQSLGDTIWQMDLAGTPRSQSHTTSKEFESRTGLTYGPLWLYSLLKRADSRLSNAPLLN